MIFGFMIHCNAKFCSIQHIYIRTIHNISSLRKTWVQLISSYAQKNAISQNPVNIIKSHKQITFNKTVKFKSKYRSIESSS